jgi:eukaryotic-like serine/threonine-protein kinase
MRRRGETSLVGEQLGPYYVKDRLGQGGMGAVYLARDTALDRDVALKVLLARHAEDEEFVARFQREARASAKLNHANIVQIYTVDVESDPPYMAMEYVGGENLESYIRRQKKLKWQHALSFTGQVASALASAHGAGIIHRDIKPANVLVDNGGRARVTDFGIAKVMGSNTNLTGTEHTVGSPCYMSPEQCGVGEVVPASDLFSLGIMLYKMITGSVPFRADSSVAVMRLIVDKELPRLSEKVGDVPPTVQTILDTLTARDLSMRYASATQLLDDLRSYQAGDTMHHLQSLGLQKAAQAPASDTAADLTRSPTGAGVPLSDSLVGELLDDKSPEKASPRPKALAEVDLPWTGIIVTISMVIFGVLAMLYYKGWEKNRPPTPPEEAIAGPRPTDGALEPGQHPPRPGQHRPPTGVRPHPDGQRPPPRNGQRPPPPGGHRPPPPR